MAADNVINQDGIRQNNGNQNKKRRYPYKRNNNANKKSSEGQTAQKSVSEDVVKAQPLVQENAANKKKNNSQNVKNKVQGAEQAQGAKTQGNNRNNNQRKRPQVHYDHDNIKMLPNNYHAYYNEVESPGYSEYDDESVDNVSESEDNTGAVVGRNAVRELLKSNRSVDKLFVRRGDREGSIVVIVAEAVNRHIPVVEVDSAKLDMLSGGALHQGVVAMAAEKEYTDIDDMLAIAERKGEIPLIVIADEIADPYNLGALIRCAECAGAHGLVIPKRRAAGLTPVVTKASAGAIEHLAIAKVTNIGHTIDQLKKKGLWIYAAEAGGTPYYDTDFSSPAAIVFGSEGNGIGKLIISKCDFVVSIPMYGHVNSLNVSTAASVILSHAARMQRLK